MSCLCLCYSCVLPVDRFYDECKRRYTIKLWKTFTDCFNCLPVAAIVDEKIFCCHGGLSPDLSSMEQIRRIMRPTDVPDQGLLCDLLWSDPDKDTMGWGENDRGVSFTFGAEVLAKPRMTIALYINLHLFVSRLWANFYRSMSSILYVVHIRLLRMVMSSLPSASWWRSFQRLTIAVNLTMRVSDHETNDIHTCLQIKISI